MKKNKIGAWLLFVIFGIAMISAVGCSMREEPIVIGSTNGSSSSGGQPSRRPERRVEIGIRVDDRRSPSGRYDRMADYIQTGVRERARSVLSELGYRLSKSVGGQRQWLVFTLQEATFRRTPLNRLEFVTTMSVECGGYQGTQRISLTVDRHLTSDQEKQVKTNPDALRQELARATIVELIRRTFEDESIKRCLPR